MDFFHNAYGLDDLFVRVAAPIQPALSPLFFAQQASPFFALQLSPEGGFDAPPLEATLLYVPGFNPFLNGDGFFSL